MNMFDACMHIPMSHLAIYVVTLLKRYWATQNFSCFPSFLLCEKFKGNEAWIIVYQRFVIFCYWYWTCIQYNCVRTLYFCEFMYLHNRTNRWRVSREIKKIGKLTTKLWKMYRKENFYYCYTYFWGLWMWTKWKICIFLNRHFSMIITHTAHTLNALMITITVL